MVSWVGLGCWSGWKSRGCLVASSTRRAVVHAGGYGGAQGGHGVTSNAPNGGTFATGRSCHSGQNE